MIDLMLDHFPTIASPVGPNATTPDRTIESLIARTDAQSHAVVTATVLIDGTRIAIDAPVDGTTGALDVTALARGLRGHAGLEIG